MTDKKEAGPAPSTEMMQPQQNITLRAASLENVVGHLVAMNLSNVFNQDAPVLVIPDSVKVVSAEEFMPRPARLRKSIKFTEAGCFLDYYGAFKTNAAPRLFVMGDDAGMQFLSVFDYAVAPGAATNDAPATGVTPLWGDHRAYLELAYHPDYAELRKRNNTRFTQDDFALFVEENTHLFVNPTGADMLELAQELKGSRNASWQSGKRLSNNAVRLEYIETIEAKGVRNELIVPEYLEISTPIFKGFDAQTFKAAFSWKMEGEKVFFSYRLLTRLAERVAVDEVKTKIATETLMPIYSVKNFDGVIGNAYYVNSED